LRVISIKFFYRTHNMENIIEPNENFDFSKVTLAHPSGVQGGAYFTKIQYNNKPLYIQTTKSLTKQGFVKTGKKYYCDLMFDNNSSVLINWFENLEESCQKLIYEKGASWFQNALEMNDIESAFNSIIRVYKSGKYYLVRTNVKNNHNNEPHIKIFNENEVALGLEDVTAETNIISILEIQGIKFTTRNFQIEIELKQIMILNNEPIFESCLIKNLFNNKSESVVKKEPFIKIEKPLKEQNDNHSYKDESFSNNLDNLDDLEKLDDLVNENKSSSQDKPKNNYDLGILEKEMEKEIDVQSLQRIDETYNQNINTNSENNNVLESLDINIEELNTEEFNDPKELKEFDLSNTLENTLETMSLKKPNEVYKMLYEKAKSKAKLAKKALIVAYLEAKKIKNTYMIENIDNSDSEFEAELDDVSESELDDL
jgi:hypothetical protein